MCAAVLPSTLRCLLKFCWKFFCPKAATLNEQSQLSLGSMAICGDQWFSWCAAVSAPIMFCQLQLLSLHCSVGSNTGGEFKRLLSGALSEGLMIQFEAFWHSNKEAVNISQCSLYLIVPTIPIYLIGLFCQNWRPSEHYHVPQPVNTLQPL